MISVIITDDHPVVRQGIRQILEDDQDQRFGNIAEASGGAELLQKLSSEKYNVVTLDISLPGRSGLELIEDIKRISPGTNILMVSIFPEEQYAIKALKLGASGYLTKSSAPSELIAAVIKISAGGKYITESLAQKITFNFINEEERPLYETLSPRELEVIRLMASGYTTNNIGIKLSLSPKTISTYRERILSKLKLKSNADIIRYALDNNLAEKLS